MTHLTPANLRSDGSTLTGSISLPSSEPEGGEYRIESCGENCHVLLRLDQTKFGDF